MRRATLVAALVLGSALGCEPPAPVPEKPTWAEDVQPILRANCFHCHGASAKFDPLKTARWDVYDLNESAYADLGFTVTEDPEGSKTFLGASDPAHFNALAIYVQPSAGEGRMPPPPALGLSDRDIAVLEKWKETGFTKGSHSPNHKPTLKWLAKPRQYVVADADYDQVLGKLTCGEAEVQVTRAGVLSLPSGVTAPCTGTLYDGFDEAAVSLK
jgi:hypothetical protein